ncbi:MAG: hypothetical protein AAGF94_12000 [Pseudomonadota bacterium]
MHVRGGCGSADRLNVFAPQQHGKPNFTMEAAIGHRARYKVKGMHRSFRQNRDPNLFDQVLQNPILTIDKDRDPELSIPFLQAHEHCFAQMWMCPFSIPS